MLSHIQTFKINNLTLVPPIAVALAKHPAVKDYDLSSIRSAVSAGAPLAQAVVEEVNALWPAGQVNLKQGWGMTETTCSAMGWHPLSEPHTSSVGELLANCSAKIMSSDSTDSPSSAPVELPPNSRGELWVKAPNIMKGYWRNPAATAETLTPDGWLKTGDICYVDDKGFFRVVDRKKELIKVKGNQVAPAELEAVLLEHPDVADAAVVGVPWGGDERPRGYVVLKEGKGGRGRGKEIVGWMDSRVARYKRLVGGCVIVDSIPKNPVSSSLLFPLPLFASHPFASPHHSAFHSPFPLSPHPPFHILLEFPIPTSHNLTLILSPICIPALSSPNFPYRSLLSPPEPKAET
jgi:4-coumarate--CoA ligase